MEIRVRRIHDPVETGDGMRVLVDRLWPRGIRKADAALDAWQPQLAPSPELRQWYGHDPARWPAFRQAYRQELLAHPGAMDDLMTRAGNGPLTLLFAARDRERNNAVALAEVLGEHSQGCEGMEVSSTPCQAADFPGYNALG